MIKMNVIERSESEMELLINLIRENSKSVKDWKKEFENFCYTTSDKSYKAYETYMQMKDYMPRNARLDILAKLSTHYRVDGLIGYEIYDAWRQETDTRRIRRCNEVCRELSKYIDVDGYVTAFRGEKEVIRNGKLWRSQDFEKAISFSLDWAEAAWFAQRYGGIAKVYTVRIPVDSIVMYYDGRKEKEIITLPNGYGGKIVVDKIEILDRDIANEVERLHQERCQQQINELLKNR